MPQPTAVIPHPNKPGVSVTARKLTRVEEYDSNDELASANRPVAIEGPDGKPLFSKNGDPFFTMVPRFRTVAVAAAKVKRSLAGWVGVTDPDGNPAPFSAERVPLLWEEHLDVTLPVCFSCGNDKGAEPHTHACSDECEKPCRIAHRYVDVVSYGNYIDDKIRTPKTFDPDPSTTGSASPSM